MKKVEKRDHFDVKAGTEQNQSYHENEPVHYIKIRTKTDRYSVSLEYDESLRINHWRHIRNSLTVKIRKTDISTNFGHRKRQKFRYMRQTLLNEFVFFEDFIML